MSLKLICYDLNHDPLAWEQIVRANVDVALLMNAVRPPDHLLPYLSHSLVDWPVEKVKERKDCSAVVCMNETLQCTFLRTNLALIQEQNRSAELFYVHNENSPELLVGLANDIAIDFVVCGSSELPKELGFDRVFVELYSLETVPRLRLFTKGWSRGHSRYHAYEIIDTETGAQTDPQFVIASSSYIGGSAGPLLSVRQTKDMFEDWLNRGEKLYVRSVGNGPFVVECAHIKQGAIPMYRDVPITHWRQYVGACPQCGDEDRLQFSGERVICYNCNEWIP